MSRALPPAYRVDNEKTPVVRGAGAWGEAVVHRLDAEGHSEMRLADARRSLQQQGEAFADSGDGLFPPRP